MFSRVRGAISAPGRLVCSSGLFFTWSIPLVAVVAMTGASAESFVNFESPQARAIAVSEDESVLYAVNTPAGRLAVLDADSLAVTEQIDVGLEPVSVAVRPGHPDEIWVVNYLSDSVSVVSLSRGATVRTILVGDEPQELVFSHDGARAFVSIGGRDRIDVLDANTKELLTSIDIGGRVPRSLALSADARTLYVGVLQSGNRTRGVSPQSTSEPSRIEFDPTLPDVDVVAIDTQFLTVRAQASDIGTHVLAVRADPADNRVYVSYTDANNLTLGEANLRGNAVGNGLAILDGTDLGVIERLNLDGPQPTRDTAVAQPFDIAFAGADEIYVAGYGAGAIQAFDDGQRGARIRVGTGLRALAVSPARERMYGLNRLFQKVVAIDLRSDTVVGRVDLGFDPTPDTIREGRVFAYNARRSLNGTLSCASCHVDGHRDNLVWDLGTTEDPKGPMATQSLRGLGDMSPYHWRGERETLETFNGTFDSLLGTRPLPAAKLAKLVEFMDTIAYGPNPNQAVERTMPEDAQRGSQLFATTGTTGGGSCVSCHTLQTEQGKPAFGTNREVVLGRSPSGNTMKVPQLRWLQDKTNFEHDGGAQSLDEFLALPFFRLEPQQRDDIAAFLMQLETETMPAVGVQRTLDSANCQEPDTIAAIDVLRERAGEPHPGGQGSEIALRVHGKIPGPSGPRSASLLYDAEAATFVSDLSDDAPFSFAQLQQLACANDAVLTFTGIPDETAARVLDADLDGLRGADERLVYGTDADRADTDGDGLSDGAEISTWSTDPLISDSDGDGVSDGAEAVDGTDPNVFASAIRLLAVAETGPGVELTWSTERGRAYDVETVDVSTLVAPPDWLTRHTSPVEDELSDPSESFLDLDPLSSGAARLYRIRIASTPVP